MSDLWDNPDSIDERFWAYHQKRPEVYRLFQELADTLRSRGRSRYSADAILHRIRWHYHVERSDGDFKINDHFSSRYARLLMRNRPEYNGFFETRRLRS